MTAKKKTINTTAQNDGHSVRNGVIVTVVGGLILAGLNYWIPPLWNLSKAAAFWILGVANYAIEIPLWALCLIGVFVLPTLARLWNAVRGPTWRNYTSDKFQGMIWRWSWASGSIFGLR